MQTFWFFHALGSCGTMDDVGRFTEIDDGWSDLLRLASQRLVQPAAPMLRSTTKADGMRERIKRGDGAAPFGPPPAFLSDRVGSFPLPVAGDHSYEMLILPVEPESSF